MLVSLSDVVVISLSTEVVILLSTEVVSLFTVVVVLLFTVVVNQIVVVFSISYCDRMLIFPYMNDFSFCVIHHALIVLCSAYSLCYLRDGS